MGEKVVFKPGLLGLGDIAAIDQHDAGLA